MSGIEGLKSGVKRAWQIEDVRIGTYLVAWFNAPIVL